MNGYAPVLMPLSSNITRVIRPITSDVPEQFVRELQLTGKLSSMRGDFTVDPIDTGYDLIIASGILNFAKANLSRLLEKLALALTPSGYLYLVTNEVSDDYLLLKNQLSAGCPVIWPAWIFY
ncbi:MAG: hypothetical protein ACRDBM_03420 [Sporomusa sp.]